MQKIQRLSNESSHATMHSTSLTVSVALLLLQFSDPVSIFMQCCHTGLQLDERAH